MHAYRGNIGLGLRESLRERGCGCSNFLRRGLCSDRVGLGSRGDFVGGRWMRDELLSLRRRGCRRLLRRGFSFGREGRRI